MGGHDDSRLLGPNQKVALSIGAVLQTNLRKVPGQSLSNQLLLTRRARYRNEFLEQLEWVHMPIMERATRPP